MEHRYTMPQQFMDDQSVPVRWRLYGVINGFWIGGKSVYASNNWLSKQLQCSERQISRALEELEKMGLITRNIEGYKRLILPGGMTPDVRGGRHQASGEGDASVHSPLYETERTYATESSKTAPISDSISDSIKSEAPLRIISSKEEEGDRSVSNTDKLLPKAAKYWHKLCIENTGHEPSGGLVKTMKIISGARKTINYVQIKEMMDDWFNNEQSLQPHEMIQITRCLSSFQIDKYVAENL